MKSFLPGEEAKRPCWQIPAIPYDRDDEWRRAILAREPAVNAPGERTCVPCGKGSVV